MSKTLLSALALAALSALTLKAQAEAPKPTWTVTGNAGLFSDYRFRGFTQTAYKPSFQGGFDVAHGSGFYFGNWNANVEQSLYRGATLEMDVYAGYKFTAGPVSFDLGAITCRYPTRADTGNVGDVHHDEIYMGLSYGIVTAKYSHQLSNYFGLGDGTGVDTKGGSYLDLGAAYDLGSGWGLNAHYGHQTIRHATDPLIGLKSNSVDDYKVGVTKDLKGWVVNAAWIGTSKKDYFTTGVSAPEVGGRGALVVGCSRTF
ncbi:MAG TPA: TorF family putative porin [Holophagaceae bacterium]|nr:TorF family putative porin [Holophagaceae bacterium]